jgi:hypothetical protein
MICDRITARGPMTNAAEERLLPIINPQCVTQRSTTAVNRPTLQAPDE